MTCKSCPADKVCNPRTSRCVLRDGRIGRLLGSARAAAPAPRAAPKQPKAPRPKFEPKSDSAVLKMADVCGPNGHKCWDAIQKISKSALRRLLGMADTRRANRLMYEVLRGELIKFSRVSLAKALAVAENRAKTPNAVVVTARDVAYAAGVLSRQGHQLPPNAATAMRDCTARYPSEQSCLALPHETMKMLLASFLGDDNKKASFTPAAVDAFRATVERHLVAVLRRARVISPSIMTPEAFYAARAEMPRLR